MPKIYHAPPGFVFNPAGLVDELELEIERLRGIVPEVLEKLNDDLCAENQRLKEHAVILAETARQVECERCANVCEEVNAGNSYKNSPLGCAKAIRELEP